VVVGVRWPVTRLGPTDAHEAPRRSTADPVYDACVVALGLVVFVIIIAIAVVVTRND
jgi:hypothetical protein